jgi:hypothetical protein
VRSVQHQFIALRERVINSSTIGYDQWLCAMDRATFDAFSRELMNGLVGRTDADREAWQRELDRAREKTGDTGLRYMGAVIHIVPWIDGLMLVPDVAEARETPAHYLLVTGHWRS